MVDHPHGGLGNLPWPSNPWLHSCRASRVRGRIPSCLPSAKWRGPVDPVRAARRSRHGTAAAVGQEPPKRFHQAPRIGPASPVEPTWRGEHNASHDALVGSSGIATEMSSRSDASCRLPGAPRSAALLPRDQTHLWFTTWLPVQVSAQVREAAQRRAESISAFIVGPLQAELDRVTPRPRQPSSKPLQHHSQR